MEIDMNIPHDVYRSSRIYYIIAAAAEYFISILVGTTYLAKLAASIGLDDGTIGVITSFLALGCGFQIVALFFPSNMRAKRPVIIINIFNQLCFTLLYIIPLFEIPSEIRSGLFIILLLLGNILLNIAFTPKVIWSRGLVDDDKRGRFSATCEIVSLVSGMVFTMSMGALIDALEAEGSLTLAFVICGAMLAVLTALHTVLLILMKENTRPPVKRETALKRIRYAFTDRATLTILPLYVLWYVTLYITTPFFGTYQLNELGFSMTVVSVLSLVYALLRSIVSRPMGALGDRRSFVSTMSIGFIAIALGFILLSVGGRIGYIVYYMLYAVTLAATNSGQLNIIYDYVAPENRSGAVAILYTIGGFSGFFATMAIRPLVDHIQASGNRFLGIDNVYAQQVLGVFGAIGALLCLLYLNLVVRRLPIRGSNN